MNENIFEPGNYFYEKLRKDSKVFNEVLDERKSTRRGTTATIRPLTSVSKNSKISRFTAENQNHHIPIIVTRNRVSLTTLDTQNNIKSERDV
jgi:hypothetical protein